MLLTQEKILAFIKSEIRIKGYPPTVREIADAVGLSSSSTVHSHLDRLEKKGCIRRDPSKPRAIDVLDEELLDHASDDDLVRIPVVGKVTAGMPITAVENIEEYVPFKKGYVDINAFMLRVQGDSMILAGIYDGDFVIVRPQPDAKNGEIVVALTDQDEATVKRFYKERDHVRLQPENTNMEPLLFQSVRVLGKVIGIFRKLDQGGSSKRGYTRKPPKA